jgi:hypothetical protein
MGKSGSRKETDARYRLPLSWKPCRGIPPPLEFSAKIYHPSPMIHDPLPIPCRAATPEIVASSGLEQIFSCFLQQPILDCLL